MASCCAPKGSSCCDSSRPVFSFAPTGLTQFSISIVLVLVVLSSFDLLVAESLEDLSPPPEVFDMLIGAGDSAFQYLSCNLKNVRPGQKRRVTVLLLNRSAEPIELKDVKAGCSCTRASVPSGLLKPGHTSQLDFDLSVADKPLQLYQNFDVTIQTAGKVKEIRIRMHAKLVGVVTFGRKDFVHTYSNEEKRSSFYLPVYFSDNELVRDVRVEATGDINSVSGRLELAPNDAKLVASFFPSDLLEDEAVGEVRIKRGDVDLASIQVLLQRKADAEVVPFYWKLLRSQENSTKFEANGLITLRWTDSSPKLECYSIKCASEDGKLFETSYTEVIPGRYRVWISVDASTKLPASGRLNWTVASSRGVSKLQSSFALLK